MDVSTTFLNGNLEELVYMIPPQGFLSKHLNHLVYKVSCSLYGLKQSPRQWYEQIDIDLLSWGLICTHVDYNVYLRHNKGTFIIHILYVDDIYITSSDQQRIFQLKRYLQSIYTVTDLSTLTKFFSVQFEQTDTSIFLHQIACTCWQSMVYSTQFLYIPPCLT